MVQKWTQMQGNHHKYKENNGISKTNMHQHTSKSVQMLQLVSAQPLL